MDRMVGNHRQPRWELFRGLGWALLGLVGYLGCAESPPVETVDFPAGDLPNRQGLVSVHWLKQLLDHRSQPNLHPRPATYDQDRFVVVEASWATLANASDYHRGHVPGAIHVNTDLFETGHPQWRLKPLPELQEIIGDLGITPETTVIVYGEQLIAAARVWWILGYAGVADVRLLDGDMRTWRAAGFLAELSTNQLSPTAFSAPARHDWLIATAELRSGIVDGGVPTSDQSDSASASDSVETWMVLDVRSESEFRGSRSGYSYLDARGRLPTARWVGDADDSAGNYKRADGRLKSPTEVFTFWASHGITDWPLSSGGPNREPRPVVFYCGSGWRSSVAFFYAWLAGATQIRNYSDGWSGWSTDYVPDPSAGGGTPGYRQVPTANPRVTSQSGDDQGSE